MGGQNVRIVRIFYFVTLKLFGLYGFFFQIVRIVRIFILEIHRFCFNFHSFQQVFHENFKKKSRQNEVSLTYFLHSKYY